jgi:uncharacterized protein (DUF1330 family)
MTAYIVFTREKTLDPGELDIYRAKVPAARVGHAVTGLAAYGAYEVLEGPAIEGAVILSFPTFAEAKAWYDGPAYVEAREHRFKGAEYRAFIIEGVPS